MLSPAAFPDLTPAELAVEPVERAATIPASWYVDPRFHDLDRAAVFAATWQHVGDAATLDRPGALARADVAGEPLLILRPGDGGFRAFYDVCRHRGGPLALKDGPTPMLQCRYHGWTYRLDGTLRGVPHFNRTELFDKRDYGLVPVALAEWEGHVFVHLGAAPTSLESAVAGIREDIAPTRLPELRFAREAIYDVRCNWKVYVDNFLEGYHVPHVHPELCRLYDFQAYRTEVRETYSVQIGPLADGKSAYAEGGGRALYYHVFPNFMLNVLPGRLQTNVVLPVAADRCRVVFRYYYADTASPDARHRIEADVSFSDGVQHEDIEICERVQRGIASRAYDRGRFSPEFEGAVHHFQRLLKEAYGRWLAGAA